MRDTARPSARNTPLSLMREGLSLSGARPRTRAHRALNESVRTARRTQCPMLSLMREGLSLSGARHSVRARRALSGGARHGPAQPPQYPTLPRARRLEPEQGAARHTCPQGVERGCATRHGARNALVLLERPAAISHVAYYASIIVFLYEAW